MINFGLSVIIAIVWCLVGIIFGIGFGTDIQKRKEHKGGTFHINTTNPDKDVISIELDIPIVELMNEKKVYFLVKLDESD